MSLFILFSSKKSRSLILAIPGMISSRPMATAQSYQTKKDTISKEILVKLNQTINEWCTENHVAAEFIRENPIFNYCYRDADYTKVRYNLYIDLNKEYTYSKHAKQDIAKATKRGLISAIDEKLESLDSFIHLYNITAKRLNMDQFYFFPIPIMMM